LWFVSGSTVRVEGHGSMMWNLACELFWFTPDLPSTACSPASVGALLRWGWVWNGGGGGWVGFVYILLGPEGTDLGPLFCLCGGWGSGCFFW
jgi:hypothetical protein